MYFYIQKELLGRKLVNITEFYKKICHSVIFRITH